MDRRFGFDNVESPGKCCKVVNFKQIALIFARPYGIQAMRLVTGFLVGLQNAVLVAVHLADMTFGIHGNVADG